MKINDMFNVRANNIVPTVISSDGDFYNSFVEYVRNNSSLLNQSIIIQGNPQQNYYFDIENSSNTIYEGVIQSQYKSMKSISCTPKLLVCETLMNKNKSSIFFNGIDDKKERLILENVFYKPFLRNIEKNVINGNYFEKSISLSTNTTDFFTGTKDFNSLLNLVRKLKLKNENNVVIIHPSVMNDIIDTITNDVYLNEYLTNKTIEHIRIIESLECFKTDVYGIDPTKICLIISPELQIKKISTTDFPLDYIYHIYSFVNGGDIFNYGYRLHLQ